MIARVVYLPDRLGQCGQSASTGTCGYRCMRRKSKAVAGLLIASISLSVPLLAAPPRPIDPSVNWDAVANTSLLNTLLNTPRNVPADTLFTLSPSADGQLHLQSWDADSIDSSLGFLVSLGMEFGGDPGLFLGQLQAAPGGAVVQESSPRPQGDAPFTIYWSSPLSILTAAVQDALPTPPDGVQSVQYRASVIVGEIVGTSQYFVMSTQSVDVTGDCGGGSAAAVTFTAAVPVSSHASVAEAVADALVYTNVADPIIPPRPNPPNDCPSLVGIPEPNCDSFDEDDGLQLCALAACLYDKCLWGALCKYHRKIRNRDVPKVLAGLGFVAAIAGAVVVVCSGGAALILGGLAMGVLGAAGGISSLVEIKKDEKEARNEYLQDAVSCWDSIYGPGGIGRPCIVD